MNPYKKTFITNVSRKHYESFPFQQFLSYNDQYWIDAATDINGKYLSGLIAIHCKDGKGSEDAKHFSNFMMVFLDYIYDETN